MTTLFFPTGAGYSPSKLLSTMNLYEHEVLIISPSALLAEMKVGNSVSGNEHRAVTARMQELVKWVERGHTLIVLDLRPASYYWTESGRATNTAIERLPPFNAIKLTPKSGSSIRCAPAVASVLDPFIASTQYEFVLQGDNLIPLLYARTSKKAVGPPDIVAGALQLGEGLVIFAPPEKVDATAYCKALEQLPSLLRASKPEFPPWVDRFRTSWEAAAFNSMAAQKAELGRLQAELSRLEEQIDEARQLKQLLVGTGDAFEAAAATALSELGLETVKGPYPRADLLASNGRRVAAVEAKGVEGAAKEEYVRQVMMWMPEVDAALAMGTEGGDDPVLTAYREQLAKLDLTDRDHDQDCKGILVLGTFRKTPLDQRTQQDFPENVKGVLVRQDICALTGLQLFVLSVLARSDETFKSQARDALFNTRGVLELGGDWGQALERAHEAEPSQIAGAP